MVRKREKKKKKLDWKYLYTKLVLSVPHTMVCARRYSWHWDQINRTQ